MVLNLFLNAIEAHGIPSRMRGDRGGKNIEVSVWMVKHRGAGRASFMWGSYVIVTCFVFFTPPDNSNTSSTGNTRIERLWVEVGTQFARRWRGFFSRLEQLHRLDSDNPTHLWLLHILFLDEISNDCAEFQNQWNHKPLAGAGNLSPTVCSYYWLRGYQVKPSCIGPSIYK
jgi:hypothetical protein